MQDVFFRAERRRATRFSAVCGLLIAAVLLTGCKDTTGFAVVLDLNGTIRIDGQPFPTGRVVVRDQRGEFEVGEIIGIATADATGRYTLRARAERDGYGSSCGHLNMYVDGYRYATVLSAPLDCSSRPQTIDLAVTEEG